ncbi:MAG: VWA domain-containing protein [Pseudomonadota bacterium]
MTGFKSMSRRIGKHIRKFSVQREGASMAMVAVLLVPMVGMVGMATDAARGYMIKARVGDALDAAGLAAGLSADNEAAMLADIQTYFDANFPDGYLGADVTLDTPQVDDAAGTVTLSASATIPTTFLKVIGQKQIAVSASTEITRQTLSLDLILSMDMSGSMSWSDGTGTARIVGARDAANALVDILFGDNETKDLLKIGLVPWSGKVNVMDNGVPFTGFDPVPDDTETFTNPLTGASQSVVYRAYNSDVPFLNLPDDASGTYEWQGCAYARHIDDATFLNDADASIGTVTTSDGTNWRAWAPVGQEGEPTPNGICETIASNCRACLSHGITRLTDTKSTIKDAIDELTSPWGTTNIGQGLIWAGQVLSPDAPFMEAEADPPANHQRAIVLLTDGENTQRTGDGYNGNLTPAEMDARLQTVANNLKEKGYIIYAIQFYHESGPLAELLKGVATDQEAPYYHFAPDGDSLKDVFKEVANHLSDLRISK